MANFRYYFGDLRGSGVRVEIPLYGTFMDMELNVGGSFNGSYQLDQTGQINQEMIDATIPGHSFVMAERNGVVVWGGYIWSRTYQSQSKSVQLFGQSFEMYPNNQLIDQDLDITDDRINVFCQLWNLVQSLGERNLGIGVPPATFPITNILEATVLAADRKFFGEIMAQMANSEMGFDWYIAITRVGGSYIKQLAIGNPIGQSLSSTSLVFEYPGSITNYYQTEAMADAGTNIFVPGSGEGETSVMGTASAPEFFVNGWPRWDRVISQKDLSDQALADSMAAQELAMRLPPKMTIKATMKGDRLPEFGSWGLGDNVVVVIKDPRNPSGLEFTGRIVKWSLNPPSKDNVEEYGLIFQGDEA